LVTNFTASKSKNKNLQEKKFYNFDSGRGVNVTLMLFNGATSLEQTTSVRSNKNPSDKQMLF
jgi:hypothetical protein